MPSNSTTNNSNWLSQLQERNNRLKQTTNHRIEPMDVDINENNNENDNNKNIENEILKLKKEKELKLNKIKLLQNDIQRLDEQLHILSNHNNHDNLDDEKKEEESIINNQNQMDIDEQLARQLQSSYEQEEHEREQQLERQRQQERIRIRRNSINHSNPNNSFIIDEFFSNNNTSRSGNPLMNHEDPFQLINTLFNNRLNHRIPSIMFSNNIDNMSYEELLRQFPSQTRGANQQDIERLPTDTFQKQEETKEEHSKDSKDENKQCCICLEDFKQGDNIRRLPCLHIFHTKEIDQWLRRNHVCPICRHPVDEQHN